MRPLAPRTRPSRCTLVTRRSRISHHAGLGVFAQGPPGSRLPPGTFVPFHGVFVALNSPARFWAPWSLVEYGDMPNDIAFIPDEWDPLPRIATSNEALPVSTNFINSICGIRQGHLPADLPHRPLYRRANADFEVDFELLLCGARTLRHIPSGMELLANYQWFHPLDGRDRSRPFWSGRNSAERRAYVSYHLPRDFLHLWIDIDYDLPPW